MKQRVRVAAWAGALAVLAAVFAAWLNPHLAVQVANEIRACF